MNKFFIIYVCFLDSLYPMIFYSGKYLCCTLSTIRGIQCAIAHLKSRYQV